MLVKSEVDRGSSFIVLMRAKTKLRCLLVRKLLGLPLDVTLLNKKQRESSGQNSGSFSSLKKGSDSKATDSLSASLDLHFYKRPSNTSLESKNGQITLAKALVVND